jgi:hypothetical protein
LFFSSSFQQQQYIVNNKENLLYTAAGPHPRDLGALGSNTESVDRRYWSLMPPARHLLEDARRRGGRSQHLKNAPAVFMIWKVRAKLLGRRKKLKNKQQEKMEEWVCVATISIFERHCTAGPCLLPFVTHYTL